MSILQIISITITSLFLLIIISYYILFLKQEKLIKNSKIPKSITIIIPAHNEEKYIAECIESILTARFEGKKEIIVVDDGSSDKTSYIAKKFPVKLVRTNHFGKSRAINKALAMSKSDLIAIVDADSTITKDSLIFATQKFQDKDVHAVTCVIKVKNDSAVFAPWIQLEQLYNSLIRSLFCKINVNIVTPGPLSIFRRQTLVELGGFGTKGLSEDVDIAIKIVKLGKKIAFSQNSVAETNMPEQWSWFVKQRSRFAKGWINIFKRHLKMDGTILKIYTLPLAFFGYFQSVIMGLISLYNIISGYFLYFASKGIYFNMQVLYFFFNWFSIFGTLGWFWRTLMNPTTASMFDWVGIISSLLIYPLYIISIIKFEKKLRFWHLFAMIFLFPFWSVIMFFYLFNLKEVFVKKQDNIWDK